MELAALERLKIYHLLIMGKGFHTSSFIFHGIIIKVAGNQKRYKSSDELEFWPGSDNSLWSYLPLNDEYFTLPNLNTSEASWPISIKF